MTNPFAQARELGVLCGGGTGNAGFDGHSYSLFSLLAGELIRVLEKFYLLLLAIVLARCFSCHSQSSRQKESHHLASLVVLASHQMHLPGEIGASGLRSLKASERLLSISLCARSMLSPMASTNRVTMDAAVHKYRVFNAQEICVDEYFDEFHGLFPWFGLCGL